MRVIVSASPNAQMSSIQTSGTIQLSTTSPEISTETSTNLGSTTTSLTTATSTAFTSSPSTVSSQSSVASNTPVILTTSITAQSPAAPPPISTIQSPSPILPTSSVTTPSVLTQTVTSTSGQIPQTSTSTTLTVQSSTSGPSNGFFTHTGAVIGLFAAIGVVIVLLLVILCMCMCNRRRASEDDPIFERIPTRGPVFGGDGPRGLDSLLPVRTPTTNAYPDLSAHTRSASGNTYNPSQDASIVSPGSRPTSPPSYRSHFNSLNHQSPPASSIAFSVPHGARDSFYSTKD